jgi:hypothetical protein
MNAGSGPANGEPIPRIGDDTDAAAEKNPRAAHDHTFEQLLQN